MKQSMKLCETTDRTVRGKNPCDECAVCNCAEGSIRPPSVAQFAHKAEVCAAQFRTVSHSYPKQAGLFEARQRLIAYRKPKRDRIAENRAALELGRPGGAS